MRIRLFIALAIGHLLFTMALDGRAATPEGTIVKVSAGNREYSATLFEPRGQGPFPALVEIHGVYGREPWDLEMSAKLADEGYVTLAVDLYGRRARDYYDGLHLRDQVRPHVAEDLQAAVAYLRTRKNVSTDRVGAIGWCMGGGFVLQLAIAEPTLAAGVIYYGPVEVDEARLKQVHARLLGFFGEEDRSIPVPAVKMMANGLKEAGNPMELHIVPDARHGFAQREYGAESAYMPEASAEAWKRALSFLNANVAGNKGAPAGTR